MFQHYHRLDRKLIIGMVCSLLILGFAILTGRLDASPSPAPTAAAKVAAGLPATICGGIPEVMVDFEASNVLQLGATRSLAKDPEANVLWIGLHADAGGGIYAFNLSDYRLEHCRDGATFVAQGPQVAVNDLIVWHNLVCAATDNDGVWCYDKTERRWDHYNESTRMFMANDTYDLVISPSDELTVGTWNGGYVYAVRSWANADLTPPDDVPLNITSILYTGSNGTWIGTMHDGVYRHFGALTWEHFSSKGYQRWNSAQAKWETFESPKDGFSDEVRDLALMSDNSTVAIVTDEANLGVRFLNTQQSDHFPDYALSIIDPPPNVGLAYVDSIDVQPNDDIWLTSWQPNQKFHAYFYSHQDKTWMTMISVPAYTVVVDGANVYIGTQKGVERWHYQP